MSDSISRAVAKVTAAYASTALQTRTTTPATDAVSVQFLTEHDAFFSGVNRLYNDACSVIGAPALADVIAVPTSSLELLSDMLHYEADNYSTLANMLTDVTAAKGVRFGRKRVSAAVHVTQAKNRLDDLKRVLFGVRSYARVAMKAVGAPPPKAKAIAATEQLPPFYVLEKAYVKRTWVQFTVEKITDMFAEGVLTVPDIQRGFVKATAGARGWVKTTGADNLIADMLNPSISKGSLLFALTADGTYDILDGQQRCTVAHLFRRGELSVSITMDDGNVVKATFDMLSPEDQHLFLNETFNVEVISPTDLGKNHPDTVTKIGVESFLACNDTGIPLTEDEKNAARLGTLARGYIKAIANSAEVKGVLSLHIKDDRKALTAFVIRLFVMADHRQNMSCDLGKVVWELSSLTEEDWESRTDTMINAILAARMVNGLKGAAGKFSTPLAETTIVVFYELVRRGFVTWARLQDKISDIQQAIASMVADEEFSKYIHVGTNNPSAIEKEVDGKMVGRYPFLVNVLGRIFDFTYDDFRQSTVTHS